MASARQVIPLVLLLGVALCAAPSVRVEREPASGAAIYRRTLAAIAWVHAADQGKGTGWIVDRARRLLVTNYHVVGENKSVEVFFPRKEGDRIVADRAVYLEKRAELQKDGLVVRGRVLRRNPDVDLALVELESLPAGVGELRLAAESAQPGDRFFLIGNRYDCEPLWVNTHGSVRQRLVWKEGYFNSGKQLAKGVQVVLTQAPINEGDSGAPAVNERGDVIGVAAAVVWEAHGGGLLIDVEEVRRFIVSRSEDTSPLKSPFVEPGDLPAPRAIYNQGLHSFALVQTAAGEKRMSGWIVDRSRRLLLTTADAVGKYEKMEVTFPLRQNQEVVAEYRFYRAQQSLLKMKGQRVTGTVLAVDARRNLALVELPSLPEGVTATTLARESAAPGDALHFLSNPQRLEALWIYSSGSVRQLGHGNLGQTSTGPDPAVVIVQAPLGEGDGGGLALDERGDVAGMISGKVGPQQQVAFCLAVAEIKAFLDEQQPRWDPHSSVDFCERGVLFTKAGQLDRAVRDFDEAVRVDPKCATAFSERGKTRLLQGKLDDALGDCDRAIQLDDKLVTAYCHRANVWIAKGEAAKAVADCDVALKRDDKCGLAYCVRADARRRLGELDRALADCDEAVWHDRRLATAHLVRGEILVQKDDLPGAVAAYTAALQLDPQNAEAYRRRGDAYWLRSDVTAALADYVEAIKLKTEDAASYLGRGRCLAARGEHDAALDDFKTAIRLDAQLAAAYVDRGSEYLRREEWDKAFADYASAVAKQASLVEDVLTAVERRAAAVAKEDKHDPETVSSMCRRALLTIRPALQAQPDMQKLIDDGLAAAGKESNARRRATLLHDAVGMLRGRIAALRTT